MNFSYESLLVRATAHLNTAETTGQRYILGLTGAPGAGKSTLAERLVLDLNAGATAEPRVALAPMDGFHLANRVLESNGSRARKGAVDTFDAAGYANLMERLRARTEDCVYVPEFRRDLEEPIGSALPISRSVALVITEGNYLLVQNPIWQRARATIDEVWFLDPPTRIRQERLIARHIRVGKAPEAAREWSLGSDETNAQFIAHTRASSDLIVHEVESE